jgi:methylmalonyl-CoA mutase C-terminal domain/subunit
VSAPALRVLIGKPGLDGHDRGALVLTRALREAGFEVTYTGIRQTPESIARQAKESSAEIVGLSILSGAHLELVARVIEALDARGLESVPVMVGGIIPAEDQPALLEMGVVSIFGPGSRITDIAALLRQTIEAQRQSEAKRTRR